MIFSNDNFARSGITLSKEAGNVITLEGVTLVTYKLDINDDVEITWIYPGDDFLEALANLITSLIELEQFYIDLDLHISELIDAETYLRYLDWLLELDYRIRINPNTQRDDSYDITDGFIDDFAYYRRGARALQGLLKYPAQHNLLKQSILSQDT